MNVIEAIRARKSVRAFRPDPIPKETLLAILEAANWSPSWADTQPWEVYVAAGEVVERIRKRFLERYEAGVPPANDIPRPTDWPSGPKQRMLDFIAARAAALGFVPGDEEERARSMRRNFEFFGAPVVVYLCLHKDLSPWSYFDLGLYAQSVMLAALEHSVGSVVAVNLAAYPDILREELGIPDEYAVMIGIALGYEDPDAEVNKVRSIRRPVEQAVTFKGI
ncbi:MAG: nitroreductase [Thermoleophilia bacterium]|nr:nitroreductase [Thermoleophilia bacterium]